MPSSACEKAIVKCPRVLAGCAAVLGSGAAAALSRFCRATMACGMYALSLHDALPIWARSIPISSNKSMIGHTLSAAGTVEAVFTLMTLEHQRLPPTINYNLPHRKSTRLNSSHLGISYAVLCLRKSNSKMPESAGRLRGSVGLWRGGCAVAFLPRDDGVRYVRSFPTRRSSDLGAINSDFLE